LRLGGKHLEHNFFKRSIVGATGRSPLKPDADLGQNPRVR
jgi:hypothetical protein